MSNLVLYGGTLGAIIVLGYTLYCRYRIARLEKQIADMEALKAGVATRDEKISPWSRSLKVKRERTMQRMFSKLAKLLLSGMLLASCVTRYVKVEPPKCRAPLIPYPPLIDETQ
jgi:hypothetical protein